VPAKSFGATLHSIQRHGGRAEAVLILRVDVLRTWLWKNRRFFKSALFCSLLKRKPRGGRRVSLLLDTTH
jgi:hypothetical protein